MGEIKKKSLSLQDLSDLGWIGSAAENRQSLQNEIREGAGPPWRRAMRLATKTVFLLTSFSIDLRWSLLEVVVHWLKWDSNLSGPQNSETFCGFAIVWRCRPIVSRKWHVDWALLEFLLNRRSSWRKDVDAGAS